MGFSIGIPETFIGLICDLQSKDQGPGGLALVRPGAVIWVITFSSSIQVSGFGCQQAKSTRWLGVAHDMDFLSPLMAFSCNPIRAMDSGFEFSHMKPHKIRSCSR